MTSYPFIQSLFSNILQKSRAIEGRFFLCSSGLDLNSDEMGQVITDEIKRFGNKYPLCMMLPPKSKGDFTAKMGEWEYYNFQLYFLKTTYAAADNQIQSRNNSTGTSTHTIPQDWHDMKRAAINFIRVLSTLQRAANLINTYFRLAPGDKYLEPVSLVGKDRVSGVRLEFAGSLFIGCEIEDYDITDLLTINIPEGDNHPEHKM